MPGPARRQFLRISSRALALGLLLLVSAPAVPALAAGSTGTATQDGWWNRLQGPLEGEPDGNPVRPLVPAIPKSPNVPADAIAAGVTAGQVDKVAAVGLEVSLSDGARLESLTLRLRESPAGGANVAADRAKVVACPATAPWGPGQNANWRDRPDADCEPGRAEGIRAPDGTWTFDLTALGRLWTDPFAPLARNGVVLTLDPAASPSGAQVSWLNLDVGGIAVDLVATRAGADQAGGPAGAPAAPVIPTVAPSPAVPSEAFGSGSPAVPAGGGGAGDQFAFAPVQPSIPAQSPAEADSAQAGTVPQAPPEVRLAAPAANPGPEAQARPAVDFWERLPASTVLLVPVVVGLAVLIGVVLGPGGRPAPVLRREGGLSRALARRNGDGV